MTINENPSGLPEQEPTSHTAVVLCAMEAWVKTGGCWESASEVYTWETLRDLAAEEGGATLLDLVDLPEPGPWLRGDELQAAMPTLKEGDVVEVGYKGHTATGELWSAGLGCLVMWRRTVRTSKGEPDFYVDALRIIERAPEPDSGADIPDEVVAAAVEAATGEWDSGRSVTYSDAMRAALAAADAKRAELEAKA